MNLPSIVRNPLFLLTIGAIFISFSGVWVTIADVEPSSSAFYRVFFGFLFLLPLSWHAKEKILPGKHIILLAFLCGIVFALDLICWHHSILRVGPGLATILGNFQVFILAGIGIFFLGERYSKLLLVAIPLAIGGLFMIVGFDWTVMNKDYLLGIYFGLATAVFYSSYILSLRLLSSRCNQRFQPMLLVSLTTAMVLGLYIQTVGGSLAIPDLGSFLSLAGLGFFSQCLGWLLIATSLSKINASHAGLILLLQPTLSFVWDVLFFSRPTEMLNWAGVFITMSAIYFGLRAKKEKI